MSEVFNVLKQNYKISITCSIFFSCFSSLSLSFFFSLFFSFFSNQVSSHLRNCLFIVSFLSFLSRPCSAAGCRETECFLKSKQSLNLFLCDTTNLTRLESSLCFCSVNVCATLYDIHVCHEGVYESV